MPLKGSQKERRDVPKNPQVLGLKRGKLLQIISEYMITINLYY